MRERKEWIHPGSRSSSVWEEENVYIYLVRETPRYVETRYITDEREREREELSNASNVLPLIANGEGNERKRKWKAHHFLHHLEDGNNFYIWFPFKMKGEWMNEKSQKRRTFNTKTNEKINFFFLLFSIPFPLTTIQMNGSYVRWYVIYMIYVIYDQM